MKPRSAVGRTLSKLPADFSQQAVRDISFLTACVIARSNVVTFPRLWHTPFTAIGWYFQAGRAGFYRSVSEYSDFQQTVGTAFFRRPRFARQCAERLRHLTDALERMIADKPLFLKQRTVFFQTYDKLFAYHQAVKYGGDYLHEIGAVRQKPSLKPILTELQNAYTYNELVIPHIDQCFRTLRIDQCQPEEIGSQRRVNRGRSVLQIGRKQNIFSRQQANQLFRAVQKRQPGEQRTSSMIVGKAVGAKSGTGIVRVIRNQRNLRQVRPGDIVVTPMTRPQFNPWLRRAAGFVTDEGGQLCHAAILARELRLPCIISTGDATARLQTGQKVHLDGRTGTVEILNQS